MTSLIQASAKNLKKNYSISNEYSNINNIFNEKINISIWKRNLSSNIENAVKILLNKNSDLEFSELLNKYNSMEILINKFGEDEKLLCFYKDITNLIEKFCSLFNIKDSWLRIDAIDKPMCPRFHSDYVKCRLITTYLGPATQWLPNSLVNRDKLGHGNNGLPDNESGLFSKYSDIKQMNVGDVGLLKGEAWINNEGFGLVHRSPDVIENHKRLYVTLDFDDLYRSIFNHNSNFI
ncbi:MAG: DUF1826 domain-containing protein [Candidatus Neomarinimicrobiota bacterium]|tara:strand:+ start:4961 stop:5665 length:705 start_codon:yes stop_codon:yes gene_type:complete